MEAGAGRGRDALVGRVWDEARGEPARVVGASGLGARDLERLATAAYLAGSRDAVGAWERAYRECLREGLRTRAAKCAFWLAHSLFNRGDIALGTGWLSRAAEAIGDIDCAERGYLLIPQAIQHFEAGELHAALAAFESAGELADRFGDADLAAFARMGRGQVMVALGDLAQATALLDAAMVAVCGGEVSPMVAGLVYCGAIEACREMADLRRAREWTGALSRWCDEQPELVPFRGQCLVHRAEIMELHGDWEHAIEQAHDACTRLAGDVAVGEAHYRMGELQRLRGDLRAAEDAYRAASQAGRQPQPGLALLRLAQDRPAAAEATIRRVVEETTTAVARWRMLAPYVEIALAIGKVADARRAADELTEAAAALGVPLVQAHASLAVGAVLIAEGDAGAALPVLRSAWSAWRRLDVPYEAARVRVLVALACRALGDTEGAELEFDAARLAFERLGARTELGRLEAVLAAGSHARPGGLTDRELEVLVLAARGMTNKQIGSALVLSEHTIARHLQNIFVRLGVSSRTAATMYAKEHGLL